MLKSRALNLRDIGGMSTAEGTLVPQGLYLRSGKLSVLSRGQCQALVEKFHIKCVIDLRTPLEALEFPDPLPSGVEYVQLPLLKDGTVGITHETGSDPMTIIRNLRKQPDKLLEMVPDFKVLYRQVVTDDYSRSQLDRVVAKLRQNAEEGRCTLFHCTAGKDRTGIVGMALLKSYGVADSAIVEDYLQTNRSAFWPTIKKCVGIWLLTANWQLVKTAYHSFMAERQLIEAAIKYYV